MRTRRAIATISLVLLLLALLCAGGCDGDSESTKIQVYYNAKVFTADKDNPIATAFAVKDDKFVCVGDKETVLEYLKGQKTEMIDLKGARVLPGFIEGHNHKSSYMIVKCHHPLGVLYTDTLDEIKKAIKKHLELHPDLDIVVVGNTSEKFSQMCAKDWDEVYAEKPMFVIANGAHAGWVNSKMLKEMGLTKDTVDPVPGISYFRRDAEGNPDGYIMEIPAMMQVCNNYPIAVGVDEAAEALAEISPSSNMYGYTGSLEAQVQYIQEEDWLKALSKLEKQGSLTLHEYVATLWLGHRVSSAEELKDRALAQKKKYSSRLIHPGTIKMFADGTPGSESALMRQEYENRAGYHGLALAPLEDLITATEMCRDNGLNIHVHAIGDAAIDNILSVYEKIGKMEGVQSIAHFQFSSQDLINRAAKAGVVVNTTPCWTMMPCEDVTNLQASKSFYNNIQPAFEAGIPVNFSSDTVGSMEIWDPLFNIFMAVTRKPDSDEYQLRGTPITIEQAIEAYTINPPKERGAEKEIGSITKGKYADFIILSKDILENPENMFELTNEGGITKIAKKNVFVDKTYFCGKCVFTRADSAQ